MRQIVKKKHIFCSNPPNTFLLQNLSWKIDSKFLKIRNYFSIFFCQENLPIFSFHKKIVVFDT